MQFAKATVLITTAWLLIPFQAMAVDEPSKPKVEILTVTSKSVQEGKSIPVNYTGEGKDNSPDLSWAKPPASAQSVAVTCEDPDAPGGTWFHWIVYNLAPSTTNLKEGVEKKPTLAGGAGQGTNDFGKVGYNGPMPPKGTEHHYQFKVFALDSKLDLKPGCDKKQFYKALSGHVVGRGKLTGLYKRL